jgi:hypothetical protein
MIIENREMRVIYFGSPDITNMPLFRLAPGNNEVSKKHWDLAAKDSIFQHKIKVKTLVVLTTDDKAIEDMETPKAVEVISNMWDPLRLAELSTSSKKQIAKVAMSQLEKIKNYGEQDEEKKQNTTYEDLGHNLSLAGE